MFFEGDPEPTPPEGMVTVGRFESPVEAQMAKGLLESAGVECFLVGENANNLMQSAFRVRLQVRDGGRGGGARVAGASRRTAKILRV